MMVFDGGFYKVVVFSTSGLGASICRFLRLSQLVWGSSAIECSKSKGFAGGYTLADLSSNPC